MNYTVTIFFLQFISVCVPEVTSEEPIVKTTSGEIRGVRLNVLGKNINGYFGIPYAKPPLGELRFRKPIPINSWRGIYNATRKSSSCPQSFRTFETEWAAIENIKEDCLYLNIWAPDEPAIGKATIIWIHGGAFLLGSSVLDLYDGQILASQGNVIVASMNYRLGSFGFLYLGTDDAPGNVGLHDQLLAIRWIKDNLSVFGGDPSLITICGQSAGAMSASFHLLSPLSRGLANRVILQSGSSYNNIFTIPPILGKIVTAIFSSRIGCHGNLRKPKNILRCLRNKNAEKIYSEEIKMVNDSFMTFLPIYSDEFLPYHPIDMINNGNFQAADMLIGNTADEGSMFVALRNSTLFYRDRPETTKDIAEYYIRDLLRYNFEISLDDVIKKYIEPVPNYDSTLLLKSAYQAVGSSVFVCPSIYIAEKFSVNSRVYYYYFTHRSSIDWNRLLEWMGVHHLQEIPFVFGEPLRGERNYLEDEILFSADIIEAWSSFARTGVPHYLPLSREWPNFSPQNNSYVELNPFRVTVGNDLIKDECDFWRNRV